MLNPRNEVHDFRDREFLHQQPGNTFDSSRLSKSPSTWDHIKDGLSLFGITALTALITYNVCITIAWVHDSFWRKRAERYGHWKRDYARQWNVEG